MAGFWLKPETCVLRDGTKQYVLLVRTGTRCIEPAVGRLRKRYLSEELTGVHTLTMQERRRFDRHRRRCLSCSCAIDNLRQERAASDFFGFPVGDRRLKRYLRTARTEMTQAVFERAAAVRAKSPREKAPAI